MTESTASPFTAAHANSLIDLSEGSVEVLVKDTTISATGIARLDLRGSVRVTVEANIAGTEIYTLFDQEKIKIKYGSSGVFTEMLALERSLGGSTSEATLNLILVARREPLITVSPDGHKMKRAVLHVLNFTNFLGPEDVDITSGKGRRRIGRIVLTCDDWECEIKELEGTKSNIKSLRIYGGNAITHICEIRRYNQTEFTRQELDSFIHDIHRFLSFSRGSWVPIFGPTGYNELDGIIYENWGSRISSPWQTGRGWFDPHHSECLAQAFSGFRKLLHDSHHGKAVNAALHWYLRSNRAGEGPGVDGGLILSVAALERLSHSILENNGISTDKIKGTNLLLRQAFSCVNINTAIPNDCSTLLPPSCADKFTDGPEAITFIRNGLVHPVPRLKSNASALAFEAWNLAQWYIELILLRMSGYTGVYSRRLSPCWVGEVHPMP